jgi:exosortase
VGYLSQVAWLRLCQSRRLTCLRVLQAAAILLLIGWLYHSILLGMLRQWWDDPNFSHGFFVPLFSCLVIWQNRGRLATVPRVPSLWGLPLLVAALCALVVGVLGQELFLSRASLLLLIAALVIFFFGWTVFRAVLFPWAVLLLMIPIPPHLFGQITSPLQRLASWLAATILPLAGVPVLRQGNIINLPAMPLEVAEACSGIRSLLSLTTLAVFYGYLNETRAWVRLVLAVAAIPIAILANSLRIIGTGLTVQYWDPDKAEGFFHLFSGWLVFVAALAMLFLLHWLLRQRRRIPNPAGKASSA